MDLVEGGKRGFSALALMLGVCLTSSCVSTTPPSAADWRTLQRVDLPAQLVQATWSDEIYLSEGHPMQFGRTAVRMQPSGAANPSIVKATINAAGGVLVDNLNCYNTIRGERKCALLLDQPDRCYLFVAAGAGAPDTHNVDVACPAHLTLGK
jgi:hypothetical protein